MVHAQYVRDDRESIVGHMVEEMGEVLVAVGKIMRFGYDSYKPELPPEERETNFDWLKREVTDLHLVLDRWKKHLETTERSK